MQEAGAVLAGGHSINDEEPKYGLSVTGFVNPKKMWKNSGAEPGDALILTKPIGTWAGQYWLQKLLWYQKHQENLQLDK